jgi:hypothetical protein
MRGTVVNAWVIGPYTISEIEGHGFAGHEGPLFSAEVDDQGTSHELYESLDRALAEAIGRRWTGPRGAGGSGVDTAAGWFRAMSGAIPAPTVPAMLPPAVEAKDPHCPDASCLGKLRPALFHGGAQQLGWTCPVCLREWLAGGSLPVPVVEG